MSSCPQWKKLVVLLLDKMYIRGLSVIGGLDYWTGILEWTIGMTFDPNFNIIIIVCCCYNQQ